MDVDLYNRLVLTFKRLIDTDEVLGRTIPESDLPSRVVHAVAASSEEEAVGFWKEEMVSIFWWSEEGRFQISFSARFFFEELAHEVGFPLVDIDAVYIVASRDEEAKVIMDDGVKEREKVVCSGARVEAPISQVLEGVV